MTHSLTHSLSDKVTYILSCPGQKKNKALGEVSPAIGPKKSVFLVQKNGGGEVRRLMEMPYFFPFLFVFPIESSRNSVELSKDREDRYRLDLYIFCFSLSQVSKFSFSFLHKLISSTSLILCLPFTIAHLSLPWSIG